MNVGNNSFFLDNQLFFSYRHFCLYHFYFKFNKIKKKKSNSKNQNQINSSTPIQARIAVDLKELRNSSVFAFFMINSLFVLIVFLLQLNKDNIHVKWPLGVKTNITLDPTTQEVTFNGTSEVKSFEAPTHTLVVPQLNFY